MGIAAVNPSCLLDFRKQYGWSHLMRHALGMLLPTRIADAMRLQGKTAERPWECGG